MFEQHYEAIITAASNAMPYEMCGVIHNGVFIPLDNVHEEPTTHFRLRDADARYYLSQPGTEAIVHSHPTLMDGVPPCPSDHDMRQQIASGLPWVLAAFDPPCGQWRLIEWGDHLLDLPVTGPDFVHGVTDCFAVIRRWYWQERGIKLKDIPRGWDWWKDEAGSNLYETFYKDWGFERIYPSTPADLRPGDVFFIGLMSDRLNHAGVFVGNGKAVHHPFKRKAYVDIIGPWFRRIGYWVRYKA